MTAPDPDLALRGQALLANRSRQAVFLCYHSVHACGPSYLSVAPDAFEEQLHTLGRRGWRSGDAAALLAIAAGERPSAPTAFLTFDDAYVDNYTTAWPIMREHGFTGHVFVVTDRVGVPLDWPEVAGEGARRPEVMRAMDWPMIEEMAEAGVAFGSHTRRHRPLTALGDDELAQELLDSRRLLQERLGRCDVLAYPFGDWDLRVVLAAARAGYSLGMALRPASRARSTPLSIPRLLVDHRHRGWAFRLLLSGVGRRAMLSPTVARLRRRPLPEGARHRAPLPTAR